MTILAECFDCGREYRLEERMAGKRIRCKECGEIIDVPERAARRSGGARGGQRSRSGRRRQGSSAAADKKTLIIVGSVFGGIALVLALVFMFGRGDGDEKDSSDDTGTIAATEDSNRPPITNPTESPVEKALKEQRYRASLDQQRVERSNQARDGLARDMGADKVVTVVFANVVGDSTAAHKYLNRKVFRAAYEDYRAGQQQARAQTEQNRQAAEQQAVQQHKDTWGGFGPGFVQYRYKQVRSDMPYPRIVRGPQDGTSYTYHVGPAVDPTAFARRVGVGQIRSITGRTIQIDSALPTPIPDPDVEELELEYGRNNVAHVTVSGATGELERVELFIKGQVEQLEMDGKKVSLVAFQTLGDGRFQFSAGPVSNMQVFAERLSWATIDSSDTVSRKMTLAATLPTNLPSKAELTAAKQAKDAKEKAIRDADWAKRPRPDESEIDWALRVIKENDSRALEKALKALALMDVEPERLEEVSEVLCRTVTDNTWHVKEHLDAMLHWKTDRTERAIMAMGGSFSARTSNAEALMQALVKLNTENSARALASALADFFSGDKCVPHLIEIGSIAEPHVLAFLKHKDEKVRRRVYTILAEIGTAKSISPLKSNIRLEKAGMQLLAEDCLKAIRERTTPATDDGEENKDADTDKDSTGTT